MKAGGMQLDMLLWWTCSAGVLKLVWLQIRRGQDMLGGLVPQVGAFLGVWDQLESVMALL